MYMHRASAIFFHCPACRMVTCSCIPDGHLHRVTYTRRIDTINSPDDRHVAARNI